MTRRAALVAVGGVLALVPGACSADDDDVVPTPGTGSAEPRYERYVALGDSFAAFGPVAAPTTGPPDCLRSTRNYPAVLAGLADIGELIDVSCGGARTADTTAPQHADTPPQFDALTPDTDLVPLTLGGNDIGFGDIVRCVVTARTPTGAPCRDRVGPAVTAALDALPARLDAVYAGIRERSPDARVIATTYLPLVPPEGVAVGGAGCDFVSAMAPGDVVWTREVTDQLNAAVIEAAGRAGAEAVMPTDATSRNACAPASERYTDFTGTETGSHPMHPTATGQEAVARAITGVL